MTLIFFKWKQGGKSEQNRKKSSPGKQFTIYYLLLIYLFERYVVAVSLKRYFGFSNQYDFFHLLHFVSFWVLFFFLKKIYFFILEDYGWKHAFGLLHTLYIIYL